MTDREVVVKAEEVSNAKAESASRHAPNAFGQDMSLRAKTAKGFVLESKKIATTSVISIIRMMILAWYVAMAKRQRKKVEVGSW